MDKRATKLSNLQWESFLAYLLVEKKFSKKESAISAVKSRFNTLQRYFRDKDFNKDTFVLFLQEADSKGWKESYQNKYIAIVKHLAKKLELSGFEDFSYFYEERQWDGGYLTQEQEFDIARVKVDYKKFKDMVNKRQEILGELLAITGCRIDEALSLKQENVKASPEGHFVFFKRTKFNKFRTNDIPEWLYKKIKLLTTDGFVFLSARGHKKLRSQEVCLDWKRRAAILGIEINVTSHLFRHSAITRKLRAKMNIQDVAMEVGHTNPKTTMDYQHVDLERIADIALEDPIRRNELTYERGIAKARDFIKRSINTCVVAPVIHEDESGTTIFLPKY